MNWLVVILLFLSLAMLDGIYARREEQLADELRQKAETAKATVFHALAECLNGKSIGEGDHIVDCRPRKK